MKTNSPRSRHPRAQKNAPSAGKKVIQPVTAPRSEAGSLHKTVQLKRTILLQRTVLLKAGQAGVTKGTKAHVVWWKRWIESGGSALMFSIAVHVVIVLVAGVWVVKSVQAKRKLTFSGAPPSSGARGQQLEYRVQNAKRAQSMSAPAPTNRLTTTAVNTKVALPEVATFSPSSSMPSKIAGIGGAGLSFSSGQNKGAMSAPPMGGSGLTAFGFKGGFGLGLIGTFYDLKQTSAKEPLNSPAQAVDDLKNFIKNWDPAILAKYYRARQELSTQRIYLPELQAVEATRAFGVENDVKPSLWVVHYRGKVIAPKTGVFRFRGLSSDWMTVRFDKKNAFDGGSGSVFALDPEVNQTKSAWINMVGGKTYDMEILIGNYPGGVVYANLFIEEKNRVYDRDESGEPILQLFQIGELEPMNLGPDAKRVPPFAKEQLIFKLSR